MFLKQVVKHCFTTCAFHLRVRNESWEGHASKEEMLYRGTSSIRKRTPLGPYRRPMPRVLGWS